MWRSTVLNLLLQLVFPDTTYFDRTVSYKAKMFMKLTAGLKILKTANCGSVTPTLMPQ
jgi:hypothetical protein